MTPARRRLHPFMEIALEPMPDGRGEQGPDDPRWRAIEARIRRLGSGPSALIETLHAVQEPPPVFLVSMGGASFDTTDELSPAVEAALPAAVDTVVGLASS